MRITPHSGPAGTVISVESVTPSPLEGEQVTFVGLFAADGDEDDPPVIDTVVEVDENGSWSGSLVVPSSDIAPPGDYVVFAVTVNESEEDFFPYEGVPFEVTSSTTPDEDEETPVPTPSDRVPSLTG
jgi:hypothetical protein